MFGGRAIRVAQKDSDGATTGLRRTRGPVSSTSAGYQSPAPRRSDPQVSPVAQMSPPVYGSPSPYGYTYSPYYSYGPSPFVTDGQSYYPSAPYSPAYYSYPGSPSYDPRISSPTEATSPVPHPGYYGYSAYQYAPATYWGSSGTEHQAASSPISYNPPAYPTPVESGTDVEDRTATPTPPSQPVVAETPAEAQ